MARFYSNENFPLPTVEELPRLGHDVLTSQDAGNAGKAIADPEVMAFAVSSERAVLTINRRHFIRLHQQGSPHYGIVVCTFDPDFTALANRISLVVAATPALANQLIRITRPHS